MATITGVEGDGFAATLTVPGQIIVSLLNDDDGTPGSLIAILGVFTDAELDSGDGLLEIVLAAPITLVPNTRYWIQAAGNSTTTYSWTQAADDSGTGVTDEYWYNNADGTITSGANSDGPAFQMAVLTEPQMAVYGTGQVGDVIAVSGSFIEVDGVAGEGLVGTVAIPGAIVVSLLSDSNGAPGSLIAILGIYEDADFTLGDILLDIDVSSLALDPNTRYWVQVQGNAFTSLSWVEAADDSGTGVATELWYEDINGTVTTGANSAGPSFQMQALVEQSIGVFGTSQVGSFGIEIDTAPIGVEGDGAVGSIAIPGRLLGSVSSVGIAEPLASEIDTPIDGTEGASEAGSLAQTVGVLTGVETDGQAGSFVVETDVSVTGTEGNSQVGDVLVLSASSVTGVEGDGQSGGVPDQLTGSVIGVAGAGQFGTAVSQVSAAVIGAAGSALAGALSVEAGIVLDGVSGSGSAGALTVQIVQVGSLLITGVQGDGAAGLITAKMSSNVPVTGIGSDGIAGDLSGRVLIVQAGVQAIGGAGALGLEIDGSITGVQGTSSAGAVIAGRSASISVTGTEGDAAAGSVSDQIAVSAAGVQGTGNAGSFDISKSPTIPVTGVQSTGFAGTVIAGRSEVVSIVGIEGTGAGGDLSSLGIVAASIVGVQGAGGIGQAIDQIAINNIPITGVQGTGSAGQVIHGKKKRSGRGAPSTFKPALFSRPDRPKETDGEAMARYRKIVDDLLAQPALPARQAEETGQPEPDDRTRPPDFSFLASLEQAEKPDVAPAVISWHAQAMEEDRLLLGDASAVEDLVRAEDDLLLGELLDD